MSTLEMDSFEIESCVGVGAFGKVYKVIEKTTKNIYALKALNGS